MLLIQRRKFVYKTFNETYIFLKSIGQSFSVSLQAVTKRCLAGQNIFSLHALTIVVRHFMECIRDM